MFKISSLERSKRKSLSIVITNSGEVVVKAPLHLPNDQIEKFIKEKEKWIETKLAKFKKNTDEFIDVINYQKLMLFGKIYPVYKSKMVKEIIVEEERILLPEKWQQEKLYSKITSWYKKIAEEYLIKRTENISENIKMLPSKIKCTGTRGRWGACNNKKVVLLNFRCMLLPKGLIDYVIIHELAHLVELNHSPKFWQVVGSILPNYKAYRQELKKYGFALKLF